MHRTRRVPRLVAAACALLALAAPAARGDAGAAAPAVAVATAAELAAAVDGGAAHIVVTDHLDLSTLPVFDNLGEPVAAADAFGDYSFRYDVITFVRPAGLASIRVRPLPQICKRCAPCHKFLKAADCSQRRAPERLKIWRSPHCGRKTALWCPLGGHEARSAVATVDRGAGRLRGAVPGRLRRAPGGGPRAAPVRALGGSALGDA